MVIITPSDNDSNSTDRTVDFWQKIGAKTAVMDAEQHDQIMAATSHLPHIMAAILVDTVLNPRNVNTQNDITAFCGSGFRDTTRVAGGSEEIWRDIVKSNKAAITEKLDTFASVLNQFQTLLKNDDFDKLKTFLADNMERRKNI